MPFLTYPSGGGSVRLCFPKPPCAGDHESGVGKTEDNQDARRVQPSEHPGCLYAARFAQILECAIKLLKQRLEQIALGDNTNDIIIVVDDRQAADLVFDH
jgi:hypothetical protein